MFNKLQKEYVELQSKIRLIEDNISDWFDSKMEYKGIRCYVAYYDIENNLINLHPEDGETWLSENSENLLMTFSEFGRKVNIIG